MAVVAKASPPPPPVGRGGATGEGHESVGQMRLMLGKRIYKYNTVNPSDVFGIKLKENLQFEGSLTFMLKIGGAEVVKVVTMTSATVVTDLLPQLIERFCFNHNSPNDIMFNPSDNYITIITDAGERRLLNEEHPLQLALDVVEHTEANPVFCFHTKIMEQHVSEEPEHKRSSKFVSYEEVSSQPDKVATLQSGLQPAASMTSVNSSSSGSSGTPKKRKAKMSGFLHLSPIMPRRGRSSSNTVTAPLPNATSNTYPPPGTAATTPGQTQSLPHDPKRTKRGRSSVGYLLDSFNLHKNRTAGSKDDAMATTSSGTTPPTSTDVDMIRNMPSPKASTRKLRQSILLPIYGPSTTVASGQVYKTVLVSKGSSTKEVIRHGLERYAIQASPDEYVLMDTIGQDLPTVGTPSEDVNDVTFTRICSRQLHKEEIPVIIDQLWKPTEGYMRRFELVKRSEIRNMLAQGNEVDSESTPLSPTLYPKRPASCMSHTEHSLDKMSDSSSTDVEIHASKSEDEVLSTTRHSARKHPGARMPFTFAEPECPSPAWDGHEDAMRSRSHESSPIAGRMRRRTSSKSGLYQVPQGSPYLLNMIPSRVHPDHLLFQLGPSTTQLGIFQQESRECSPLATEVTTATVHLHTVAELFPEPVDHLVVCKIRCFPSSLIGRKKLYPTVLEFPHSAEGQTSISVSLNGHPLVPGENYIMEHADVLQIGPGCMLMYVDPTVTADNLAGSSPRWVATPLKEPAKVEKKRRVRQGTPSSDLPRDDSGTLSESRDNVQWVSVEELEAKHDMKKGEGSNGAASMINHQRQQSSDSTLSGELSRTGQGTIPLVIYRSGRWALGLSTMDAGNLLENIAQKASPRSLSNKLAVAYIFSLGVESCRQLAEGDRDALCAEYLGKAVGVLQSSVMDTYRVLSEWKPDPALLLSALDTLHPLIGSAVFWLSNVLALCGYLKGLPPDDIIVPDALLAALHQLVQYAVQELLYPITKVLYAILPPMVAVSAMSDSAMDSKGYMDQAVNFLQLVMFAFEDHNVSSAITAQFFGMIFCFINGSVLNHILSIGPEGQVLSHFSGVQLKDCWNILEGWSFGVELKDEFLRYTAPLTYVVHLLNTPRKQLMEMNWFSLRAAHPALHPVRLHFILDHYHLPKGCRRPAGWVPPTGAVREATDTDFLKENFESHPPLDLAGNQPAIDLSEDPPELPELVKLITAAAAMQASGADYQGKRDSPYPDSGLDSPARSTELPRSPSSEVPVIRVRSATMERELETASGEAPSVAEDMVVVEAVNMDEEQPPPVHVIANSAPEVSRTGDTPSHVTTAAIEPQYTEVVVSRGVRDFGFQLKLSENPKGGRPLLVIASIVLGSLSDEGDSLLQLSVGDNVVKLDGNDMSNDIFRAEEYLRHVEDEVTLTISRNSRTS